MIALLVGIVFIVLGVLGLILWWSKFVIVLLGSLPPIFLLSGLAALALGISQIRDKIAAKKEEEEMAAEEAKGEEPKPEEPKPVRPAPQQPEEKEESEQ
jgi:hypothetical protein